jgi:hypothetical protein
VGPLSDVPEAGKVARTAAAVGCVLVCTLLAIYLAASMPFADHRPECVASGSLNDAG